MHSASIANAIAEHRPTLVVFATPALVDRRGIVRSVLLGQVDADLFAARLDRILTE